MPFPVRGTELTFPNYSSLLAVLCLPTKYKNKYFLSLRQCYCFQAVITCFGGNKLRYGSLGVMHRPTNGGGNDKFLAAVAWMSGESGLRLC